MPVMDGILVGRRGGEEEMRVEALGHGDRRDPMREMGEAVAIGHQPAVEQHGGEVAFGRRWGARGSEQDPAFLPGLADRGDAESQVRVAAGQHGVGGFDAPARENQGTGGEVDLVVTHHHEDFKPTRPVAQQQDGGGGTRGDGI